MTTLRPPRRWTESEAEIPPGLRDWLEHERAEGPSDAFLRDLAARVSATLDAGPNAVAEGSGASQAATTTFMRIARIVGTALAIGVTLAIGATFYRTPPKSGDSGAPPAERLSPVVIAAALPSAEPPSPSPPVSEPPAPDPAQGPEMHALRRQPPQARPARGAVQPSLSDPAAELELLRRARGQLASAPQRALDTTDQHRTQYRNGVFAQEREAIAIEALIRLGKHAQVQRRVSAFHSHYPNSAYRRRLQTIAPPR
jgi:hypothetical protein